MSPHAPSAPRSPRARAWRAAGAWTAALLLALPGVPARADIYRIVGPDGRITYSDRPPVDSQSRASVVHGRAASGPVMEAPSPTAPGSGAAVAAATHDDALPRPPLEPAVAEALVAVLAREDQVLALFDACARARPDDYARLAARVHRWRTRNAQVVTRASRVLSIAVTPAHRHTLEVSAQERADNESAPALRGARGSLPNWCEKGVQQLDDGSLDLDDPAIAGPIQRWIAP